MGKRKEGPPVPVVIVTAGDLLDALKALGFVIKFWPGPGNEAASLYCGEGNFVRNFVTRAEMIEYMEGRLNG